MLIGTIRLKDIGGSTDLTDYFARNQHFKKEERSMKIALHELRSDAYNDQLTEQQMYTFREYSQTLIIRTQWDLAK